MPKKRSSKEQGSDYMFVARLKLFARLNRCGVWKKIDKIAICQNRRQGGKKWGVGIKFIFELLRMRYQTYKWRHQKGY